MLPKTDGIADPAFGYGACAKPNTKGIYVNNGKKIVIK
jgi:hypothetical protein